MCSCWDLPKGCVTLSVPSTLLLYHSLTHQPIWQTFDGQDSFFTPTRIQLMQADLKQSKESLHIYQHYHNPCELGS